MSDELTRFGVPSGAKLVRASGTPTSQSLSDEYTPTSAQRVAFQTELERLADAERDEIISSSEILL